VLVVHLLLRWLHHMRALEVMCVRVHTHGSSLALKKPSVWWLFDLRGGILWCVVRWLFEVAVHSIAAAIVVLLR